MRKSIVLSLLFAFLFLSVQDADAQRKRRTKKRPSKTEDSRDRAAFKEKLAYELSIGNPGFIGGGGSSQFNFAFKPGVGYLVSSRFSPGIFAKGDFLWINNGNGEFSLFDYGGGIFAKFKIVESFYLRGEYAFNSFAWNRNTGVISRENFTSPLLGAGYRSIQPGSNWAFGGELLFHLSEDVRTYNNLYEFWIKFDYKF